MFVHVLDANGKVVAQADRLDASPFGWQAGDVIAQVHHLEIPASAASVAIGLYNSDSGERLSATVDGSQTDQVTLTELGMR